MNVYMDHAVAPQCLVRFTSTLPGIGQFIIPNYFWEFVPRFSREVTPGIILAKCIDGIYLVSFYTIHCLMFKVVLHV